jgi:small-conductance mechanosensitive channel
LQSIIFVFVKHPFDIGDRVTVYGNTGAAGTGDDYYVTAISLLYTEFKKMEGHIVQAPNSILNTLFILNHRRSGQLADVFELRMKHGTPREHIEELQARMTEYVLEHRRDFTGKIITEMKGVEDAYCITVNFICFHKSSFQNELLRLVRHNKFALELMTQMVNIGIEQPRRQYQISGREFPIYQTNVQPPAYDAGHPHIDTSKLSATRRARSDSRISASDQDFYQDVFVGRKAHPTFAHPPRIAEEENPAEAAAARASTNLERTASLASGSQHGPHGHRLFGRSMTLRSMNDRRSDRDMV